MVDFYYRNRTRYNYNPTTVTTRSPFTQGEIEWAAEHYDYDSRYSDIKDQRYKEEIDFSAYSGDDGKLFYTKTYAGASNGTGGSQANAGVQSSVIKLGDDETAIHIAQATIGAGACAGKGGLYAGAHAQLNALNFEHENVQARLGLDASTGVNVSFTDVSASVAGLGFNAGKHGVGLSTPFGGFNFKFW